MIYFIGYIIGWLATLYFCRRNMMLEYRNKVKSGIAKKSANPHIITGFRGDKTPCELKNETEYVYFYGWEIFWSATLWVIWTGPYILWQVVTGTFRLIDSILDRKKEKPILGYSVGVPTSEVYEKMYSALPFAVAANRDKEPIYKVLANGELEIVTNLPQSQ